MTPQEVALLCSTDNQKRVNAIKLDISTQLRRHAESKDLSKLLKIRYPTETDDILEYRRKNLPRITQIFFVKVANSLGRIRQARDFSIAGWNKGGLHGDFEKYCLQNYSTNGSVVDWVFNSVIGSMLVEPNGVILVGPMGWFTLSAPELIKGGMMGMTEPVCQIYRSESVKAYAKNRYCHIICSETKDEFIVNRETDGRFSVYKGYVENREKKYLNLTSSNDVNGTLSTFPAIVLGGEAREFERCEIYDSYVSASVPALDKIVQTKSEEDLMIKENVHARLFIADDAVSCHKCGGEKRINSEVCDVCNGAGFLLPTNAAAITIVRTDKRDENKPFSVPAAYLSPDMSVINTITENIKDYWYLAYSAINLEFLAQTPSAQSGIAKSYDRQDLNSFLFKIGTQVINNILNPILHLFAEILYGDAARTPELRQNICPTITAPIDFDVRNIADIQNELVALRAANVDRGLFSAMELEFIQRAFANQPLEKQILGDINQMNPLSGVADDMRGTEVARGAATQEADFIASNIADTIRDLYHSDENYQYQTYEKRKEMAYAALKKEFPIKAAQAAIADSANNDFTEVFNARTNQNNSDIAAQTDLEDEID